MRKKISKQARGFSQSTQTPLRRTSKKASKPSTKSAAQSARVPQRFQKSEVSLSLKFYLTADAIRAGIDPPARAYDANANRGGWGTPLEAAERTGHNELAAVLRRAGARSSGRSVGDTVCVRPWQGDGYCGVVEEVNKTSFSLHVTEINGCEGGCQARADCSASRVVGGADGIKVGDEITTVSWCLTHTGVKP